MRNSLMRASRVVLLAWVTASCSTWKPVPSTELGAGSNLKGDYRLTMSSQSTVVVKDPQIGADSVIGESKNGRETYRFAAPIGQVVGIEREGTSALRTAALVGGIAVGIFVAGVVLLVNALPPNY